MNMIVNYHEHNVVLVDSIGEVHEQYPQCGTVAGVTEDSSCVPAEPTLLRVLREVYGLPEPQKDRLLLVSEAVAAASPERKDLVFPSEELTLYDVDYDAVGCEYLTQYVSSRDALLC